MIKIENLSKEFNGKHGKVKALDNINLELNDGDYYWYERGWKIYPFKVHHTFRKTR